MFVTDRYFGVLRDPEGDELWLGLEEVVVCAYVGVRGDGVSLLRNARNEVFACRFWNREEAGLLLRHDDRSFNFAFVLLNFPENFANINLIPSIPMETVSQITLQIRCHPTRRSQLKLLSIRPNLN